MADLILPRSMVITNTITNYFMTAAAPIVLAAGTPVDIGIGAQSWLTDTGDAAASFIDVSVPVAGHQYAYELYVDGQKQESGLITEATGTVLELTSETAGTIPQNARIVYTIVDIGTA